MQTDEQTADYRSRYREAQDCSNEQYDHEECREQDARARRSDCCAKEPCSAHQDPELSRHAFSLRCRNATTGPCHLPSAVDRSSVGDGLAGSGLAARTIRGPGAAGGRGSSAPARRMLRRVPHGPARRRRRAAPPEAASHPGPSGRRHRRVEQHPPRRSVARLDLRRLLVLPRCSASRRRNWCARSNSRAAGATHPHPSRSDCGHRRATANSRTPATGRCARIASKSRSVSSRAQS